MKAKERCTRWAVAVARGGSALGACPLSLLNGEIGQRAVLETGSQPGEMQRQ